jgi:hypothetical protein
MLLKDMNAYLMDNFLPICMICKKEVEKFEVTQNFLTLSLSYKVSCHGDYEIKEINHEDLMNIDFKNINRGIAFNIKSLNDTKLLKEK